jgi:protease I
VVDILNCGAEIVYDDVGAGKKALAKVAVDRDLVTGFSKHGVVPFVDAIATQIQALSAQQ